MASQPQVRLQNIPTLIDTTNLVDEVLVYYSASKIFPRRVRGKRSTAKVYGTYKKDEPVIIYFICLNQDNLVHICIKVS